MNTKGNKIILSNHDRKLVIQEQLSDKHISPLNMITRYDKNGKAGEENGAGSATPVSCVQSHEFLAPIGKGLVKQNIIVEPDLPIKANQTAALNSASSNGDF